ncbi:hypothetical protein Pcinc_004138 [Petrolisthes cinctipes]|uniref:Uncharacterized protein n=1 Tax=Petrolisthes cinctipes TaxID=88211 RepID=A0AAE1L1E5_PETCI|nr:hypothetical protein Pcinc_004138 [Petrolisthes cinctipes]
MGYQHCLGRFILVVIAGLTGVAGSNGGKLSVAAAVVAGGSQEPLGCWICSSQIQGNGCYNPLNQTSFITNATRNCTLDEVFCTVNRTWYVVEGGDEEIDFSVNRDCARECFPHCIVIGDRTKIYSCMSCCTESFCNTGSSAASRTESSPTCVLLPYLMLATLLLLLPPLCSEFI